MTQIIELEELQDLYDSVVEDFMIVDQQVPLRVEQGHIAELHAGFFATQTAPDGEPWKPNALVTILRKRHTRILRGMPENNERLSRSLTTKEGTGGDALRDVSLQTKGAQLLHGTFVEYSKFNQDRPHTGMTNQYLDEATERVVDHTLAEMAKGKI